MINIIKEAQKIAAVAMAKAVRERFFVDVMEPQLNVTSSPESSTVCPNQDYNLVNSLLNLTKSPDGRIAVKACEGLMLLVSLPEPAS